MTRATRILKNAIGAVVGAAIGMLLFGVSTASAQTDPQFTQFYEVPSYYNAGALGLTDFVRLRGGMRMQWVGVDNAPRNFAIAADSPIKIGKRRIGVGLVMEQGSEGLFSNMSIDLQGAWKMKLFKGTLSLGLNIGYRDQKFKGSKVLLPDGDDYHESTDNAIPTTDVAGNALNLGVGAFYTRSWFWGGVSCTHVNSPVITFSSGNDSGGMAGGSDAEGNVKNYEFDVKRTLYFMAGGNIPIKNTLFELMPAVMVKSDFTFTRAEVMARVRYNKFLTAGIGYRYDDAVTATVAADYKNFFIGYSFDYSTSAIARASSGSHEIFAGYSLKLDLSEKNRNKHKSIRIM